MGGFKTVEQSGVGRAILHQIEMLRQAGVKTTDRWEKDAKVVHVNTILPNSFFAALRAKLTGKSVVYYGHSTEEDFRNSFVGSNLVSPLFKRWITLCYNMGNVILTPTAYSAQILRGYKLKRPIYNISNGIDTDFFAPDSTGRLRFRQKYNLAKDQEVIINVGHLIERKGILNFIDLAKSMPNTQFIWFGHTAPSLITKAVKTAMESAPKNLLFAGYVNREELRDAYCGADIFAFMSHEETEGIVVLEALACKIPVIVRDIPVYENWLSHSENVYKAKDQVEFQDTCRGILHKTLPDLTEVGYQVAQSRSMAAMGKILVDIYHKEHLLEKD